MSDAKGGDTSTGASRENVGALTGTLVRRLAIIAGSLLVAALALVGLLSLVRGTPVSRVVAVGDPDGMPPVSDSLFARTMAAFTGVQIEPGNRVEILVNGDATYPRLWRDLASAQRTITVQPYYALPGAVADTMAAVLAERARAGVRVLMLLDAFGAGPLLEQDGYVERLRRAGVVVAILRPIRWYTLQKANDRSHVRAMVVDGRIGYTGGFGLADYWPGDGHRDGEWRETNVRVEGPAVPYLQAAFAAGWAEATGELLTGHLFFPPGGFSPAGSTIAGVLYTAPTTGSTPAERFLALSIASARRTLYIANAYFVPDDDFRRLLIAAAQRGVDVRVLTVDENSTDVRTTYYAGRAGYEELLRGGVRIYEYEPAMMHAKTFVVDGLWSTVGSMNFDNRSLAFNNESNVVALDASVGATADSLFRHDLRFSREVTLAAFERRPWTDRLVEWGASLVSRVL